MAKTYRDELNREFVDLKTLSQVLGYTERHTKRLIRDNNWLSIKRGRRFVLKDDFLRSYPDLSPTLLSSISDITDKRVDKTDIKADIEHKTDVRNVQDVQSLEETDKGIIEFESLDNKEILYQKTVNTIQRLEKTLANVQYIQQDTKRIDGKVDKQGKELRALAEQLKGIAKPRLNQWLEVAVMLAMLAMIGFMFYKVYGLLNSMGV